MANGGGEREICYASLAFNTTPTKPIQRIPPQLRNHHNTNKSLWSARRDRDKEERVVCTTQQDKPRKEVVKKDDDDALETLPPVRWTKQMTDKQSQTEKHYGFDMKRMFLVSLTTFVTVAIVGNASVWGRLTAPRQACIEVQPSTSSMVTLPNAKPPHHCYDLTFMLPGKDNCEHITKQHAAILSYSSYVCTVEVLYVTAATIPDIQLNVSVSHYSIELGQTGTTYICKQSTRVLPSYTRNKMHTVKRFLCERPKMNLVKVIFPKGIKLLSCFIRVKGNEIFEMDSALQ